jgi:hypothetical protein
MSTNWSVTVQVYASVGVLLAVAGVCISRLTKEANVMITIAQAIILRWGQRLERPIWRHVSNFRGVSAVYRFCLCYLKYGSERRGGRIPPPHQKLESSNNGIKDGCKKPPLISIVTLDFNRKSSARIYSVFPLFVGALVRS